MSLQKIEEVDLNVKILNYTRLPLEDAVYANRLAYSMHLALQNEDGSWTALNHNSGVLFVKATENEDGALNPKSLKNPWLFSLKEDGYGVFAVRTLAEGEEDVEELGTATLWFSKDLLRYEEVGQFDFSQTMRETEAGDGKKFALEEVRCAYDAETGAYLLQWKDREGIWRVTREAALEGLCLHGAASVIAGEEILSSGDWKGAENIQGVVPRNVIEIPEELGSYLRKKLMPATNVGVEAPGEIRVKRSGQEDGGAQEQEEKGYEALSRVRVNALYSDGTKVPKKVIWNEEDLSGVDFAKPGRYTLRGKIYQPHFAFPICTDRADPCVCRWNDKYYFIATNDADNNHTLYMRCADTLEGIADAEEHLILDSSTYEDVGGLLWAPEFHVIDGNMYIFHAATPGPFFNEESHIIALREGGNPLCKEDWSRPRRIVKQDGSDICEAGKEITLDMTEFEWQGELYVIWSQRQFLPKDLGAWLYVAKLNREKPWMLASESVVLSKPEYGWANNHTFVDEGPFALIRGDKLYVTFSSAAVDSTYVVGLLQIDAGKDLLDPSNWRKTNYPLFTSRSLEGEYGTGHNAYVIDEDGITWNTYHARPGIDGPRSSGFRRVHFDVDGEPMLDVTEELDLKPEFADVETTVVVE